MAQRGIIALVFSIILFSCREAPSTFPFDIPVEENCVSDTINVLVQPFGAGCQQCHKYLSSLDYLPQSCQLFVLYAKDHNLSENSGIPSIDLREYSLWTDNYNKTMLYTINYSNKRVLNIKRIQNRNLPKLLEDSNVIKK